MNIKLSRQCILRIINQSLFCILSISRFWTDFFKFSGTLLHMSSSYHPQIDRLTENMNRIVEQYLHAFVDDKPSYLYVFFLGQSTTTILRSILLKSLLIEASDTILTDREALLSKLRKNMLKAQLQMKAMADKHRRDKLPSPFPSTTSCQRGIMVHI